MTAKIIIEWEEIDKNLFSLIFEKIQLKLNEYLDSNEYEISVCLPSSQSEIERLVPKITDLVQKLRIELTKEGLINFPDFTIPVIEKFDIVAIKVINEFFSKGIKVKDTFIKN